MKILISSSSFLPPNHSVWKNIKSHSTKLRFENYNNIIVISHTYILKSVMIFYYPLVYQSFEELQNNNIIIAMCLFWPILEFSLGYAHLVFA